MALAAMLVFLTGCVVVSLNPFYQDKDLFFEPALLGRWRGEGQHWRFAPSEHEAKAYLVTYSDGGKESKMAGHLFKLEGEWFLDLFGKSVPDVVPPLIPSHVVLRVRLENGVFSYQALNYEWMGKWLKKNPQALRHQWRVNPDSPPEEAHFVLTAETADLQDFLRKQLKNADAWRDWMRLERSDER